MEDKPLDLNRIRAEIDVVDAEIVRLLNRRSVLAQEIGKLKGKDGKPFFTPERERSVYERLQALNKGPLLDHQLKSVYREIISAARALEMPLKCAYWGPEGSFSHMAAIATFGESSEFVSRGSISDVFLAIEHGEADYGVVPVENSLAGVVPETLDMFPQTNAKICAEKYVPIDHNLLSTASSLNEVERIYAGPQPLHQCRKWLQENVPHAMIIEVTPTSLAAQKAKEDPKGAAIANTMAAEINAVPILARHIQDSSQNRTRFLVIGFNEPSKTGRDKTSLMFNLRNEPGQLYRALGSLVNHNVNLLMIESRPAKNSSFEYLFFIDCVGHREDENMKAAIKDLGTLAMETVLLGSYPSAEGKI